MARPFEPLRAIARSSPFFDRRPGRRQRFLERGARRWCHGNSIIAVGDSKNGGGKMSRSPPPQQISSLVYVYVEFGIELEE